MGVWGYQPVAKVIQRGSRIVHNCTIRCLYVVMTYHTRTHIHITAALYCHHHCHDIIVKITANYVPTDTEFWGAGKTLRALAKGGYFTSNKDNCAEVTLSVYPISLACDDIIILYIPSV